MHRVTRKDLCAALAQLARWKECQMPTPNVPSTSGIDGASALPPLSRRAAFLLATLFGLAWFLLLLLAFLIGNTIAGSLIVRSRHATAEQLPIFTYATDMTMVALGLLFCLLIVPIILGVGRRNYGRFLVEVGVLGGSWRALISALGLILLTTLLALFMPTNVSASFWRLGVFPWIDLAQAPLVEEILFRGIVLTLLLKRFPAWFALLWAAVLFMPPHAGLGPIPVLENGLVFGVTQGLLRLRTRSIWPGVVAHYAFVTGIGSPILIAYGAVLGVLLVEWGVSALVGRLRREGSLPASAPTV
jgi:membrane protease YdiL (CAAX protease family)